MRTPAIRKILFGVLLLLQGGVLAQNAFYLDNGDTTEVQICRVNNFISLNAIQFNSYNHETYDAWAIVHTNSTINIRVINTVLGNAYLTVSDSNDTIIISSTNLTDTIISGCNAPLTFYFHVDSHVNINNGNYLSAIVYIDSDDCQSSIWGITASDIAENTTDITFHTSDSMVLYSLDDGPWTPMQTEITPMFSRLILNDLNCNATHTIKFTTEADSSNHCCTVSHNFHPTLCSPAQGCFEATELNAEYVTCSYGIMVPDQTFNYNVVPGRHTVMRDTTQYDPRLGGILRTVCEGCDSTIRLGNSQCGSEWEAIDYRMKVDSMRNAILILKYAAVLEEPGHPAISQPRFTFDVQPVSDACSHADFISSGSMGWASIGGIMWKDWTTVGFDLSSYHGQTVNLHFQTQDCKQGGHFGYAYFTTRCSTRQIIAQECGIVASNTFTAPDGFHYRWTDHLGNTVSTSRTITVPSDGSTYLCHVTAIEDSTCGFTLGTYAGVRLPKAAGSVIQVHTVDCQSYDVSFKSNSFVTADGTNPVPYGYQCDEETWYFGDGTNATGFNPTHTYADTGTYNVTIIATLNGGECSDTAYLTVHLPPIQKQEEERISVCDSLRWRDGVLYTADTTGPALLVITPAHCDSLYTLNLRINHSSYGNQQFDTICHHHLYPWSDTMFVMPPDSTHMTLYDTLATRAGCDSSVVLHLSVRPDIITEPERDTICYGQWRLWQNIPINDTSQPTSLLCLTLRDTLMSTLGCDSIVGLDLCRWPRVDFSVDAIAHCGNRTYTVSVNYLDDSLRLIMQNDTTAIQLGSTDTLRLTVDNTTAYLFTAGYTDSLFCPADTTLVLQPISIPEAALKLTPQTLTYDNLILHAYDLTNGEHSRHWTIVHADGDSIRLLEDKAHLVYTADVGDDSTRVVLTVGNGLCLDTITGCIYLVRTDFFAPNVFTPGQSENNRFVISGIGIHQQSLSIFNRMGLLVYSTDHPEEGWDGTHEGVPCMQGAYVWHLTYSNDITPTRLQTAVGTVTLIR